MKLTGSRMAVVTVCVLVPFLFAGCGKKVSKRAAEAMMERAIEKDTGKKAKVNISEGGFKMTTEKGDVSMTAGEGAAIPKSFPEDILVYKGAKVVSSMEMPEGTMVTLQTTDPIEKVFEAYLAKMVEAGWTKEATVDMGGTKTVAFKKTDKRTVQVMLGAEGGRKTSIMLTVSQRKDQPEG